jgi:hypothetical protein
MILSLDISTKLGYYKEGESRAHTINLGKGDKRFENLYCKLEDLCENHIYDSTDTPYKIVYEGAAHQKGFATPLSHGLVGVLKAFCFRHDIELESIHAMTVKRIFLDKPSYTKEDCLQIAEERDFKSKYKGGKTVFQKKAPMMAKCEDLGIEFDDDNSADAYAVYYTYREMNSGKI